MPKIDADRLLGDLYALRKIGEYKTGVHRPALSPEDIQSRHWLAEKLTAAGLTAEIDGIANVFGRDRSPGRKLLMGSHIETQPHAGWLDGAMGVIFGLEAARALGGGIDVAAWFDEEGWFGGFPGQPVVLRPAVRTPRSTPCDAPRRRRAVARGAGSGGTWRGRPRVQADPARYLGYLEAHIEQGAELELCGDRIGIVTAIVGSHRFRIVFEGDAEPCRHHADGAAQGRRRGAGPAGHRDQRPVPGAGERADGVDHGPDHARSRVAQYRAGEGGDGVPVPRYRSRDAGPAGPGTGGAGRRGATAVRAR